MNKVLDHGWCISLRPETYFTEVHKFLVLQMQLCFPLLSFFSFRSTAVVAEQRFKENLPEQVSLSLFSCCHVYSSYLSDITCFGVTDVWRKLLAPWKLRFVTFTLMQLMQELGYVCLTGWPSFSTKYAKQRHFNIFDILLLFLY